MRRFLTASILLLAVAAYGQDLVEKIDVTLVNVDVTVTSKDHSVHGLTRDDFEVFEDGVPQTITHFYGVFDEDGKTLGVQSFETRAHAAHDEPTNHGELTHTALIRLTPGTVHTVVVAIHDQITDAVGVAKQRIDFQERERTP